MRTRLVLPFLVLALAACEPAGTTSVRSERAPVTTAPATTAPAIRRLVPATPKAVATSKPTAKTTTRPPTPKPAPKPAPVRATTTAPKPVARSTCGAPPNPWGYGFCGGSVISNPPSSFCDYFDCIASFWENTAGYVMQCEDHTFSHSGGRQGSCSHHGGNLRALTR